MKLTKKKMKMLQKINHNLYFSMHDHDGCERDNIDQLLVEKARRQLISFIFSDKGKVGGYNKSMAGQGGARTGMVRHGEVW